MGDAKIAPRPGWSSVEFDQSCIDWSFMPLTQFMYRAVCIADIFFNGVPLLFNVPTYISKSTLKMAAHDCVDKMIPASKTSKFLELALVGHFGGANPISRHPVSMQIMNLSLEMKSQLEKYN